MSKIIDFVFGIARENTNLLRLLDLLYNSKGKLWHLKKKAKIRIKNNMGGKALIQLYHWNIDIRKWESKFWVLDAGKTSASNDPLVVSFKNSNAKDYWAIQVSVMDGGPENEGIYGNANQFNARNLHERLFYGIPLTGVKGCPLKKKDKDQTLTFKVSKEKFNIIFKSRECTDDMVRIRDYSPVTNIFVLMLENHSFDNIFGASGIKGLTVPPKGASNSFDGKEYPFTSPAPFFLKSDPGPEFKDVVEQLKGPNGTYNGGAYGTINNEGFVQNYATSKTEGPPPKPRIFRRCDERF